MTAAALVLLALGAAFVADRLLLAAEARGWIYWRRKSPNLRSVGSAALELQSILEPGKKYVLEVQRRDEAREAAEVDEASPGEPSGNEASPGEPSADDASPGEPSGNDEPGGSRPK